jgi:hypothetical protein
MSSSLAQDIEIFITTVDPKLGPQFEALFNYRWMKNMNELSGAKWVSTLPFAVKCVLMSCAQRQIQSAITPTTKSAHGPYPNADRAWVRRWRVL